MTQKYLIITFFLFFGSSINSKAKNTPSFLGYEETLSPQDNEIWIQVIDNNNLKIYLKEEVLPEGRFIAYKFENSSDLEISFSWDVIQHNNIVQENNDKKTLKPNSIEVFFDPTVSIQLKDNESLTDFSLNIKY